MRSATAAGLGGSASSRRHASVLRRYRHGSGRTRELVAIAGAQGSLLLVDRDLLGGGDARLVAHLASDEPPSNALLLARIYLAAAPTERRCRVLEDADTNRPALPDPGLRTEDRGELPASVSCAEGTFRLARVPGEMSIPSLRWIRESGDGCSPVSLREAIAALESYEPLRALTRDALWRFGPDPSVSSTVLRAELGRVLESPIVLNRALREAVLARVSRGEMSMSEIAIRCGRLKHDSRGNATGETSWLARRIGLLAEGGQEKPTRWVHSDVLGLIARQGLGLAPREVELG